MTAKARITLVGPGNLGAALALSLHRARYPIESVIAHSRGRSFIQAGRLARKVGGRAAIDLKHSTAKLVWFCVPDAEIRRAARAARDQISWRGRIALHSSGALDSDELHALRQEGAAVASVHPLMTFVRGSQATFAGVPFAIEGDPAAVHTARAIVRDLGGFAYSIQKKNKAAYHAWATFVSPLLTALLSTSERVARAAGVAQKDVSRRMIPILRQTLANYAAFGASNGFSGPLIRGDVDTVKRHLRVLRGAPEAREVYLALAHAALRYLPGKNKKSLRRLLDASQP